MIELRCSTCDYLRQRKDNGNCPYRVGPDGLPVQCVGVWAKDKHSYISRYIEATKAVRSSFLPPRGLGGAAYIDLFAGPGLSCVRETEEIIEGSPLIAVEHASAPFTKLIFCDIDKENSDTLRERTRGDDGRIHVIPGDCNIVCEAVMEFVPEFGLNIALVDPFAPSGLHWDTMKVLGSANRMDFIITFHSGAIKRNLKKDGYESVIDRAIGNSSWRDVVREPRDVVKLIGIMRGLMLELGYEQENVRSFGITNSKGVVMYHLMFAAKHRLGNKIWNSIGRNEPGGQITLGF